MKFKLLLAVAISALTVSNVSFASMCVITQVSPYLVTPLIKTNSITVKAEQVTGGPYEVNRNPTDYRSNDNLFLLRIRQLLKTEFEFSVYYNNKIILETWVASDQPINANINHAFTSDGKKIKVACYGEMIWRE